MNVQPLGTNAEKVTIVGFNTSGATIEKGMGAAWNLALAASMNASEILANTAGLQRGFIGVANSDIAANAYGVITCWGYVASVLMSHVGTSITITAGDILKPGAVAGTFFSSLTDQAVSTIYYRYVVAASTPAAVSTKAQSYGAGVVFAL